jgi:hypothetical protein
VPQRGVTNYIAVARRNFAHQSGGVSCAWRVHLLHIAFVRADPRAHLQGHDEAQRFVLLHVAIFAHQSGGVDGKVGKWETRRLLHVAFLRTNWNMPGNMHVSNTLVRPWGKRDMLFHGIR